jgi:hypothetical protein
MATPQQMTAHDDPVLQHRSSTEREGTWPFLCQRRKKRYQQQQAPTCSSRGEAGEGKGTHRGKIKLECEGRQIKIKDLGLGFTYLRYRSPVPEMTRVTKVQEQDDRETDTD